MIILIFKHTREIIYELDPRLKLIWLMSYALVYIIENRVLILVMALSSAFMFLFSGAHKTIYMKALYYIFIFLIILFLFITWGSGGGLDIISATIIILKWLIITLSSIAFFVMTRPFEIMSAMRSLRVPEAFVFSLGMGFRFIPIIIESSGQILMAQKARGLLSGKGIKMIFSLPVLVNALAVPLIIETLNRLWEMWLALVVRGFDLHKEHKKNKLKLSISNLAVLIYSVVIMAASAAAILYKSS